MNTLLAARLRRRFALALPVALAAPRIGATQGTGSGAWPTRPIRIVVAFGTGGGTDVTTRLLAPRLAAILGQPVVVENRAGGGGTLGADYVAKLPPDGTTFVLATLSSIGIAPALYPRLPYDPARDLVAVAPTVYVPICLTVTTSGLDARDVPGFVAGFLTRVGATAEHVPFRNPGETYAALVAGRVQFTSDIPSLMLPYVRERQARILFVATPQRMASIPDVPTAEEVGLSGYRAYSWYGLFGPAGTPPDVVSRMAAAVEEALGDPGINARFEEFGTPAMRGWDPARFGRYVREEIEAWGPLVRASGARVE